MRRLSRICCWKQPYLTKIFQITYTISYWQRARNRMGKDRHALHKNIGKCINNDELSDYKIIRARECGGQQNVPLFCSIEKSNATEYCNVDMLMIKDNKVKVIFEIEETDVKPTQICGKFLTSALSTYYIHQSKNNTPIELDESVLFIQILDTSQLKEGTSKIEQWENLGKSIKDLLPIGKIGKYKLFYGNCSDFKNRMDKKCTELITCIKEALNEINL